MYLPVVNPNVGYSLARELMNVDDEDYMEKELDIIEKDNPTIAVWIRKYAETTDDPMGAMYCALLVYKMLYSQAEADKMAEDIILV